MKVIALVPSAGSGIRMASRKDDKPFLELGGKPLVVYVLSLLDKSELVDTVKLVVKEKYVEKAKRVVEEYGIQKVSDVIPGGQTRTQSVSNGLSRIEAASDDIILIHDGVRPFLTETDIRTLVDAAKRSGAAVLGVSCTSTIKKVNEKGIIEKTVSRKDLWEAQTPQAFRYSIIKEAYQKFQGQSATDDSCFVEQLGRTVCVVPGPRNNIKVTLPEDLALAEAILEAQRSKR